MNTRKSLTVLAVVCLLSACGSGMEGLVDPHWIDYSRVTLGDITFRMVFINSNISFPTGIDDSGVKTSGQAYWLATTEVTSALWQHVYQWALANGYVFANNPPPAATPSHPAASMSWRDAIIWVNALTEYYNRKNGKHLTCAYYSDPDFTTPLKIVNDSTNITRNNPGSQDAPYVRPDASGFRLPSLTEWELAARYIADTNNNGRITEPGEYYPGDYASGASAEGEASALAVAVFNGDPLATVASLAPNALGIYDMSGNVWEYCSDWQDESTATAKGGSFTFDYIPIRIGYLIPMKSNFNSVNGGIRIALTATMAK